MTDSTSVLLYLIGGGELRLNVDPGEWASAFDKALRNDEAIRIDDPSGGERYGINPRAVLYWKPAPSPAEEPS